MLWKHGGKQQAWSVLAIFISDPSIHRSSDPSRAMIAPRSGLAPQALNLYRIVKADGSRAMQQLERTKLEETL